ncbi:hypothetical protein ACFWB2_19695 [Streptomyces virginiae]|uniref:hypothetical protein n=1 Tax=Streptomyces virginiae TaxID=1961 RepID=UPI003696BB8A
METGVQAVALLRDLARSDPQAHRAALATALASLAGRQGFAGRAEEALACALESLALRRELVAEEPRSGLNGLGNALNDCAAYLHVLDRDAEAIEMVKESITVRIGLARQDASAFLSRLDGALNNLEVISARSGDEEAVARVFDESLLSLPPASRARLLNSRARRRLRADAPEEASLDLLRAVAEVWRSDGRRENAEAPGEAAAEARRAIHGTAPDLLWTDGCPTDLRERLPTWASDAVPTEIQEAITRWQAAEDWTAREDVLLPVTHCCVLQPACTECGSPEI